MIGKRILREKSREQPLGKENRSILANYMSALNFEPKPINRFIFLPTTYFAF